MPNRLIPAAVAASLVLSTVAPSYAGGFAEPRIEPEVMAPETVAAGTAAATLPGGILIPLLLLALIAAAGAASGGGGGGVPPIGPA